MELIRNSKDKKARKLTKKRLGTLRRAKRKVDATPRTFGQLFLFTRYLWKALPALRMGLSILPPPAIHPTMARLAEGITFLEPEGSFTLVFLVSGLWAMTVA